MTIQLATTLRNARLDQVETTIGTAPILRIRTGTQPATCETADSGTVLATITCPSDWAAAASGGSKAKSGTWQDSSADASGTAGHFRLYEAAGTNCYMQGSVGQGSGDLSLDNNVIASGQSVTISTWTMTDGNA